MVRASFGAPVVQQVSSLHLKQRLAQMHHPPYLFIRLGTTRRITPALRWRWMPKICSPLHFPTSSCRKPRA